MFDKLTILFKSISYGKDKQTNYIYTNHKKHLKSLIYSQYKYNDHFQTHVPTLMYAKIVFYCKNKTFICTIDGNSYVNTVTREFFDDLSDNEKSLKSCYLQFKLGKITFDEQFYIGKNIILGNLFIKKHIEMLNYEQRYIMLKDSTKLDIFNDIPKNTISICIENLHFLAIIDTKIESSIISLDILENLKKHNTTLLELELNCYIYIDNNLYQFNNTFKVVDNYYKYVILGFDFMKKHVFRVGKTYLQLKNGLRVHYL